MADNTNKHFKNLFLDIKYNLAQNIVQDEEGLSDIDNQICEQAISLWKKHTNQVSNIEQTVKPGHIYSAYDISCLIDHIQLNICAGMTETLTKNQEMTKLLLNIKKELFKFVQIFDKLRCRLNNKIFLGFMNNVYFTPKVTIDYVKTSICLLENTELRDEDKYELACYFCLKEQIEEYFHKTKVMYGSKFNDNEAVRMRVFWTYHLLEKDEEFNQEIKSLLSASEVNNEHILFWAIRHQNEVAVQYIFENFSDNLKKNMERIVGYSLYNGSTNILCYLVSQVKEREQLTAICLENGYSILIRLFSNERWSKYFKKAFTYMHQSIDGFTVLKAIHSIIGIWLERKFELETYIKFLKEISVQFKVDIRIFIFMPDSDTILKMLLDISNENMMRDILKIGSYEEFKTSANIDGIIIPMGKELINNEKKDLFETFLRKLFIDGELQVFKEKFLEATTYNIC